MVDEQEKQRMARRMELALMGIDRLEALDAQLAEAQRERDEWRYQYTALDALVSDAARGIEHPRNDRPTVHLVEALWQRAEAAEKARDDWRRLAVEHGAEVQADNEYLLKRHEPLQAENSNLQRIIDHSSDEIVALKQRAEAAEAERDNAMALYSATRALLNAVVAKRYDVREWQQRAEAAEASLQERDGLREDLERTKDNVDELHAYRRKVVQLAEAQSERDSKAVAFNNLTEAYNTLGRDLFATLDRAEVAEKALAELIAEVREYNPVKLDLEPYEQVLKQTPVEGGE